MNRLIHLSFDIDEVLEKLLDLIFSVIEADRGFIMFFDEETGELFPKAVRQGNRTDKKIDKNPQEIAISRTIIDHVLRKGESVITSDAMRDKRFRNGKSVSNYQIRSAMCVPLRSRSKLYGIIHMDDYGYSIYSEDDLKLLTIIGSEAGVAVENAQLMEASLRKERLVGIGQTVAGLAHYVKNILNGIKGGSSLIKLGIESHKMEDIDVGWQVLNRSLEKISTMVTNMLTYSKDREPDDVLCDPNEIISNVIDLMKDRAAEKSVTMVPLLDSSISPMLLDPLSIHSAVLNLVTNAMDAIEEGTHGTIHITTTLDKARNGIEISVRDTGQGISPADMPRIFNMFMSTKGSRGTGLGLPVTQKIVQEHKGSIQVQSKVGQGTTFTIFLPFRAPAETKNSSS